MATVGNRLMKLKSELCPSENFRAIWTKLYLNRGMLAFFHIFFYLKHMTLFLTTEAN